MKRLLLILFILAACAPQHSFVTINKETIPVELATTASQQETGLMYRTSLSGGMLFIFDKEQPLSFWMKNTLIPLDMVFIDNNYEIVKIHHAIPCVTNYCDLYSADAHYVLEVNENFSAKHNITEGMTVIFKQ